MTTQSSFQTHVAMTSGLPKDTGLAAQTVVLKPVSSTTHRYFTGPNHTWALPSWSLQSLPIHGTGVTQRVYLKRLPGLTHYLQVTPDGMPGNRMEPGSAPSSCISSAHIREILEVTR